VRRAIAALLLLAGAAYAHPAPWPDSKTAGIASNSASDTDGDGGTDLIYCGDYDSDGTLEMVDDVQGCVDALDDTGPKTLVLLPGNYAAGSCDAACETRVANKGIIQLEEFTTLSCLPGAVLNGYTANTEDIATSVVTNSGHTSYTVDEAQSEVHVVGCEIDGGIPDTFDGSTYVNQGRAGIQIVGCTDCSASSNYIHDTLHAAIQNAKTTRFVGRDNRTYQTAAYGDTSGTILQATLYTWTQNASDTEYTAWEDNRVDRSGGTGIQLRRDTLDDDINFTTIRGNTVSNGATGAVCMKLRGATDTLIQSNRCVNAGAFLMEPTTSRYRDDTAGTTATRALSNVRTNISDFYLKNVSSTTGTGGIYLAQFQEDTRLANVTVDATLPSASGNQNCIGFTVPQRGLVLEGVRAFRCGMYGLFQIDADASGASAWEELNFNNILIDGCDWSGKTSGGRFNCILLQGAHANLHFSNFTIRAATDAEFQANQSITNSVFENFYVDSVDPGYRGAYTEAQANAITCDATDYNDTWIVVTDASSASDCTFASGTGATANACFCNGTTWANYSRTVHEAVDFADGTVDHSGVVLRNWVVKNATNNDATVNPYIRLTDGAGYVLENVSCIDDSLATTTASAHCIQFVTADNGPGEFTGIRMTGVRNAGLTNADSIAIDEGAGGDDLFSTEFAYLFHRGTADPTAAVFATDACGTAYGSTWIDSDDSTDPIYECETGDVWAARATP
jgi:hypothetical protein